MSKPTKSFTLRLPYPDYERLKKEASSFGQSLPDWIRSKLSGDNSTELTRLHDELLDIRTQLESLQTILQPLIRPATISESSH